VLHPLPRVDELSYDLDEDPRSIYFQQAARGVPVRMAAIGFLLGHFTLKSQAPPQRSETFVRRGELECANANCITHAERQYLSLELTLTSREPLRIHCAFCEVEQPVSIVGCATTHHYHPVGSSEVHRIKAENLVVFASEAQAAAAGFQPAAVRGGAASH
jgi:hypothetical protein